MNRYKLTLAEKQKKKIVNAAKFDAKRGMV
jgi:hypothetical protein